jgi:preprotein translocase subunit SecE
MKIKTYIQESIDELLNKVSWPTWSELQGSSIVVLVASLLIAIVVFAMDSIFSETMKLLYKTLF